MSALVVGVLGLQGDVREHLATLAVCGARAVRVRTAEELVRVDALVIPGGESTTMSKLAVAFGLMEPLRARVRAGMPAYGSCAGMIMLAERLLDGRADQQTIGGLDVVVRRNAFGRQVDSFEADLDFPALLDLPARHAGPARRDLDVTGAATDPGSVDRVHAIFIRAPWVEEVGPGVEVLARVAGGPAAGRIVAVRQGPVLATSFHPELTGDTRVHALFLRVARAAVG